MFFVQDITIIPCDQTASCSGTLRLWSGYIILMIISFWYDNTKASGLFYILVGTMRTNHAVYHPGYSDYTTNVDFIPLLFSVVNGSSTLYELNSVV